MLPIAASETSWETCISINIYTSAHPCVYPYTFIVQHVRGQCLRSLQHHASSAFQKQKTNRNKNQNKKQRQKTSKRFLLELGTAHQKQTRTKQQTGGRKSISSEAQRSTAKHSEAQRNTEKHKADHSKAHSIVQHSTAKDSTRQNANMQRSIAHSMRQKIQHSIK